MAQNQSSRLVTVSRHTPLRSNSDSMLDIKYIRENLEAVTKNAIRRGSKVDPGEVVALDDRRLELQRKVEDLRAERNRLNDEIKKAGKPTTEQIGQSKEIKEQLVSLEASLAEAAKEVLEKASWLPNLLSSEVPDGKDDYGNVEIKKWGELPQFKFEIKDHQALGETLDILDIERATKVTASRFYYLKGGGMLLTWALFTWAISELVKRGFTPFLTPDVAREKTLYGTGYLPFFADDIYKLEGQDLALIGTSEQTLVAYHQDEVLDPAKMPLRYTAFSPCFRTEAGSYGKDTRGIFRVHQFHKVEQIIFSTPSDSPKCHEECLQSEEYFLQQLGIPYRVVNVCVGDFGAPGYKKYDIEAWFPGQQRYREVTSNTNLTDFQTRRLNIRYKNENGESVYLHTISATAVTDRFVIAILENFQQEDGSVIVPEVLRKYTGFDLIKPH